MDSFNANLRINDFGFPLVSVVLPVYNVGSYIKEAIDSILNQTIQDFEILIIDDCSSDDTLSIVRSFNDDRIIIVTKEQNKGLVDSLNIGFKMARGKYISRMDGDDINVLSRFEEQIGILENNPGIKACGCWMQQFGLSNKIISHREYNDEIVSSLLLGCSMNLGCTMLDREWAMQIQFDENKKHVEDYDFWSRLIGTGEFYNIQRVLYYYRMHEYQVSTIHNATQKKGDVFIKIYLLKKFNYDVFKYNDPFLEKMLYLNDYFSVEEFGNYLDFLKEILKLNQNELVFKTVELKKVLNEIKNQLIFKIYFHDSGIGITKEWRKKALIKLSVQDILRIVILKSKEKVKLWTKKRQ